MRRQDRIDRLNSLAEAERNEAAQLRKDANDPYWKEWQKEQGFKDDYLLSLADEYDERANINEERAKK